MTEREDLGLGMPLAGVRLLEASAGTGKTFTLATLYSRALFETGLPVDALLAVTFTEAATQELRQRIRQRLRLALQWVEGEVAARDTPERISTAALVEAALARGEARPALRARLRAAVEAMDLAPVLTIHQFCRRALAEHALEAGQAPGEVELVCNERALRLVVATDLWRAIGRDPDDARGLAAAWPSPAALADGLARLDAVEALLPAPGAAPDAATEQAARQARDEAAAVVAAEFGRHGEATWRAVAALLDATARNANTHGLPSLQPAWRALAAWAAGGGAGAPADERVARFGTARLQGAIKKPFQGRHRAPANPLTEAIARWGDADATLAALADRRALALAHRVRQEGAARLAALKQQRRLQGFDDLVRGLAQALAGAHGEALAQRLRAQYRIAFVDEFQDTDPRQWAIFRRLFAAAPDDGGPRALFLIGDPKQAIYRFRGGDVYTYLEARTHALAPRSLGRNFRSRPRVLAALAALYAGAGPRPFGQDGIDFHPVEPGGVPDDALRYAAGEAPGLEILTWDEGDDDASAEQARQRAATACAARIHALLQPGAATLAEADGPRPLAPGDIAVLVASHREGRLIQRRLAQAGVPSVAAGRDSLYASDEAQDVLAVLEAALHLADDGRLRGALATPLLGVPATALAALDDDGEAHRAWQDRALGWRQRWERHGPFALLGDLCAAAAPRVLALEDGERRLANWLQLAEALQAQSGARDPAADVAQLRARMLAADGANDEELMRLESDAARVKVLTLHKSKGLEFPLVFLPFLSHPGAAASSRGGPSLANFHEPGLGRVAYLKGHDAEAWEAAGRRERAETEAERLRLLYVGLTRARYGSIVCFGPTRDSGRSAFAQLLAGGAPAKPDATPLRARLAALAARAPDAIRLAPAAATLPGGAPPREPHDALPPLAEPRRRVSRDWGVHSFSALVREAGGADARGAGDEAEPLLAPGRFAGARFGNVLHEALETVDFAAWRDGRGETPPPGQEAALLQALRNGGYGGAAELAEGVALLARLVRDTLGVRLPEGVRLADLPAAQRRAELEFYIALAPAAVDEVLATLHAHGVVSARRGFGTRTRLEGLLTGFIDLVYEHAGRIYLVDYKSNLLPGYAPAQLAAAMAQGEYDLQALLYTVALHRWLRFRRPDYDYEAHFGGVRYLFCRGLARAGEGLHALRPPAALVEALDRLLQPAPEAAA